MLTVADLQEIAEMRSTIYRFFAELFNEPIPTPGHELARALLSLDLRLNPKWGAEEIQQGLDLLDQFKAEAGGRDLEREQYLLAKERTRLVRGVKPGYGPRPPYEAVYGNYPSAQECFIGLLRVYRESQVSMRQESTERPDYLGIELDYLRYLAADEAQAWSEGDLERAARRLREANRFLKEHLLVWAPKYLDVVEQETPHSFFLAVALLLKGFLKEDRSLLDQLLVDMAPVTDGAVASNS